MRDVVGTTLGICLILMFGFTLRGAYAMYKAGTHTNPGYGFFTAIDVLSLLFRDAPFTDEGRKWCATFQRCFFGWIGAFFVAWIASWIGHSN